MRWKRPLGADAIRALAGSETARRKMEVLLQAATGKTTVAEACAQLGVGEAAYHKLRHRMLQGALENLEPRVPGRPMQVSIIDPKVAALEEEIRQLRIDLRVAQIWEEVALLMPHLIQAPDPVEKKRRRRSHHQKRATACRTYPEDQ